MILEIHCSCSVQHLRGVLGTCLPLLTLFIASYHSYLALIISAQTILLYSFISGFSRAPYSFCLFSRKKKEMVSCLRSSVWGSGRERVQKGKDRLCHRLLCGCPPSSLCVFISYGISRHCTCLWHTNWKPAHLH